MVREDIFGGLKNAVSRGQSLADAMQTLINAGYPHEDVEEAARALQSRTMPPQLQPRKPLQQPSMAQAMPKDLPQQIQQAPQQAIKKKSRTGLWIAILIIILLVIGAALTTFFIIFLKGRPPTTPFG
jgi:hypothetical protein